MKRVLAVIAAFSAVGLALLADSIENSAVPLAGSLLWMLAMFLSAAILYKQATRVGVTTAVCVVALIPLLGLILAPVATIIMAFMSNKKASITRVTPSVLRAAK